MGPNKLVKVSPVDWPTIRNLFLPDWPKHIVAYNTLDSYINWIAQKPSLDVNVYCLNGDWSDGTHVVQVFYEKKKYYCLYFNIAFSYFKNGTHIYIRTLDDTKNDRLKTLLELMDWENIHDLKAFMAQHYKMVKEVMISKNVTASNEAQGDFLYFDKRDAKNLVIK